MRKREFWALVIPSVLVMGAFLVLPLFRTIEWSLQDVSYGNPGTFVGLDNFALALTDARFGRAVLFTVAVTVASVAILTVLGYAVATATNRLGWSRPLVLGILLISYVLPNLVGAVAFSWLFDDSFGGLVNRLIQALGGTPVLWFTDQLPNAAIIVANTVWFMLPFVVLVIMAGLQGVPAEIIEAGTIDGANAWQMHVHVIIPTIRSTMGFVALICIMDILRIFDSLIPLSPQAATIGNESIMMYVYSIAFANGAQQLGLGSAVNVITIAIILVMLTPFIRSVFREAKALS